MICGVGRTATGVKGFPFPCRDPQLIPYPCSQSGRKWATYKPPRADLKLLNDAGRGMEVDHKGLPSRKMTVLPPSFSARIQGL